MPVFELILPEGSVLLRRPETGETLRVSAESGPVSLGFIEFGTPAPALGAAAAAPVAVPPHAAPAARETAVRTALDVRLPPGFGPDEELPFLAPDKPLMPGDARKGEDLCRVLDAPFEALTAEDFERTLESLAASRNTLEGELEFLEEIEGDEIDIEDLRAAGKALDDRIAAVVRRFEEWKAAQPPSRGEND